MSLPLELPPSPFIRKYAPRIVDGGRVLDVGCHTGRNSIYLATLGHRALGVTNQWTDAAGASEVAKMAGVDARCKFVVGDARQLPVKGQFDAVLVNEVTHLMARRSAHAVIRTAQEQTARDGLNLVSGYTVDPADSMLTQMNRDRCFLPEELASLYDGLNWRIIAYQEEPFTWQEFDGRQVVHSLATVVARRIR